MDKCIYSIGVGSKNLLLLVGEMGNDFRCHPIEPDNPLPLIGFDSNFAEDFGKPTGGSAAQQIHLKEPVSRGHISQCQGGVLSGLGGNRWNPEAIRGYRDWKI